MNSTATNRNEEPPQNSSRNFFNTKNQLIPPPRNTNSDIADFLSYSDYRYHETFKAAGIPTPTVNDAQLVALSSLSNDECNDYLNNAFDSESGNGQRLEMAKAAISAKARTASVMSERFEKLANYLLQELPNPIRAVFTREKIANKPIFVIVEFCVMTIIAFGTMGNELFYQAGVMNASGLPPYIGENGFWRATLSALTMVSITTAMKAYIATLPVSQLGVVKRRLFMSTVILSVPFVVLFCINFQSVSSQGEPFDEPLIKAAMYAIQMLLGPVGFNLFWLYLSKSSESHSDQHIVYDKEHLSLDEELGSLSLRSDDINTTVGYLQGFINEYTAKKTIFVLNSISQISMIRVELDASRHQALADMYKTRMEKPATQLKAVK